MSQYLRHLRTYFFKIRHPGRERIRVEIEEAPYQIYPYTTYGYITLWIIIAVTMSGFDCVYLCNFLPHVNSLTA